MTDTRYDWMPDWLSSQGQNAPIPRDESSFQTRTFTGGVRETVETGPVEEPRNFLGPVLGDNTDAQRTGEQPYVATIVVPPRQDRTVKRKLRGIHLFMITLNGVLGSGLYWRGGEILRLGGGISMCLSFLLLGALVWAVMQCITEFMCIWPVPGALSVYVGEFVDEELGLAVGIAYWFTYSVSFSALVAAGAEEVSFWTEDLKVRGLVLFALVPIVLVLINAFEVQIYGWIEVVSGGFKIIFLVIIAISMIVFAAKSPKDFGYTNWSVQAYDGDAAQSWGSAFLISLSVATYAYIGVEIIAASALEARWPTARDQGPSKPSRRSNRSSVVGSTVKFTAIWVSAISTVAYTLSAVLVSFGIDWNDSRLPRLDWIEITTRAASDTTASGSGTTSGNSTSAFVIVTESAMSPNNPLAGCFNAFLLLTALSCANTNLYVASRALFGLASRIPGDADQAWYLRLLSWFGKTNRHKVPLRAVVFSAVAFCWVPFIQLASESNAQSSPRSNGANSANKGAHVALEVLTEMGSVGVLMVWACECWAFIRYYNCIQEHKNELQERGVRHVRRWDRNDWNDYPYRSHGQPFTAFVALAGCLFILIVTNGASLWHGLPGASSWVEALSSSYLLPVVFLALWVLLKLVRGSRWSLVDLSNSERVVKKINHLHELAFPA